MSTIWSAATIQRFSEEGEREIAKSLKCIIARYSIPVVNLTSAYVLPTDLLFISRVTWKGKRIVPFTARDFHDINTLTSTGEPLFYVFNQQGRNTIKFHPIPSETIAQQTTGLYSTHIIDSVIVQYYQIPNSVTIFIPAYIRRRLLKYYIAAKCFALEGVGQNIKVAKMMRERFEFYMTIFKQTYSGHYIAQLNTLGGGGLRGINAPPRLSYKYGESGEF